MPISPSPVKKIVLRLLGLLVVVGLAAIWVMLGANPVT